MPEALAILLVFAIIVAIYIAAWLQSRNPALSSPQKESARLQHHLAWLEQRLTTARREKWGHEMIAALAEEQAATGRELARVQAGMQVSNLPVGN
jgi:hypothetical protein